MRGIILRCKSVLLAIILITGLFTNVSLNSAYGLLDDIVEDVQDTVEQTVEEVEETVQDISNQVNSPEENLEKEVNETIEELGQSTSGVNKKNDSDQTTQRIIPKKETLSKLIEEKKLLELFQTKDVSSYSDSKTDKKIKELTQSNNHEQYAIGNGFVVQEGKVRVVIELSENNQQLIKKINNIQPSIIVNNKLQAYVDFDQINRLNKIHGIEKIRPTFSAIQFDYPKSEGVYFLGADIFHSSGYSGKGVKIAVLDLSFDPQNPKINQKIVETKSFRKGVGEFTIPIEGFANDTGHGTAVAEIISDVAPNAELFLYSMETDIEFEAAVDEAILKGIDIIVMSAGWPNFPTDGSSSITKKVEEAIAHEIIFVIPAGNFAQKHWEGKFTDSNINGYHDFSSGDEGLTIQIDQTRVNEKKPIIAYLRWDVGLNDITDLDLVLLDPDGQIVDYSSSTQSDKDDDAFEYVHHIPQKNGKYALGIVYDGVINAPKDVPNAMIEIFMINDVIEYPVTAGSVVVPTDADGSIVVGAVNHLDGKPEIFSSIGPTNDGKNVPHVLAPDGVTTIALERPFYGTSATAPHIAGLSALILEKKAESLPVQILHEIQNSNSVLDWLGDKFENAIGYGKVNQANWQLVYLTENICSLSDLQTTDTYDALVREYFAVNEFENKGYEPLCMSILENSNFNVNNDLDLFILVYEEELGGKNLRNNKLDGFYAHFGADRLANHFVVMCDCSEYDSSYESTLPSWILSHELSHFILSFKGYHKSEIKHLVHQIDSEYENCVGKNFGNKICNPFRLTIRPDSLSNDYIVMAPINNSIGNYFVPYLTDHDLNPELIETQREITRSWIQSMITDDEFIQSLKHFASDNYIDDNITSTINIPDGFIIAEISKEKEMNWQEALVPDLFAEDKLKSLINNLNKKSVIKQINPNQEIPTWFKTRALLWSEKRIGDAVFFDGVENLFRMGIIGIN